MGVLRNSQDLVLISLRLPCGRWVGTTAAFARIKAIQMILGKRYCTGDMRKQEASSTNRVVAAVEGVPFRAGTGSI